ncbi:MAG: AAA family ATPase [Candidatus Aminicenantales bacterium]
MALIHWGRLSITAGKVFTPATPINEEQLFAGRKEQMRQIIDVLNQKGQHAIIFGERGVGKTSLANVFGSNSGLLIVHKNCDSTDNFSTLWDKIFSEIQIAGGTKRIGFGEQTELTFIDIRGQFEDQDLFPDNVRKILRMLSDQCLPVIVIDEFDRIGKTEVRAALADTIKALSDNAIDAKIILVGVADSVDELIKEHQSIERALVQIKMPRMSKEELIEILDNGLNILKMTMEKEAKEHIALLSQGLPHYAHLLGLHAARKAIDDRKKNINIEHVDSAISKALQQAQQTIRSSYHRAIMSPRKDNIFAQVLLACALSHTDDMGYFAAADIRKPLSEIMRKEYEIPSFSRHLNDFCEPGRGQLLHKIGVKHRYRFRFTNPLMQPFVTMQGFDSGLIDRELINKLKN